MNARRLLNTRYYRQRPKARRKLYYRCYGRLAYYRRAFARQRRAGWRAIVSAMVAAFVASKAAQRYQAPRKYDPGASALKIQAARMAAQRRVQAR